MNIAFIHGSAVVMLSLVLGCATNAPSQPASVTAEGADVPAYTSFGWQSPEGGHATGNPPLTILDTNIYNAVRAQLIQKGYVEIAENPDFRVSYETAPYETERKSNPMRIGIGVGSWGGNIGGGVNTSVPVGSAGEQISQESRITIRAVDQKTQKEVWVGTVTSDIEQGLDAAAVEKAVAGTMKGFPAKRS